MKTFLMCVAAAVGLWGAGCARPAAPSAPNTFRWTPIEATNVYGQLSTALWAPETTIRRGSVLTLVAMVKSHAGGDIVIPKDVLGSLALEVEIDGVLQQPLNTFEYRCGLHEHNWTMKPGDVLSRQIPLFTGSADKRMWDFEDVHRPPIPEDTVMVGVYAGQASDVVVRLGLMDSTNRLAAGTSEIRIRVTP